MPRSIQVLHVVEGLGDHLGGLQTAVVAIARAQAAHKHSVEIVSTRGARETTVGLTALGPEVHVSTFQQNRMIGRFSGSLRAVAYIWKRAGDVDVVHTHAVWSIPAFVGALAAVTRRRRLVISPHGSLESYDLRKHARAKKFLGPVFIRPLLNRAAIVLCTSEAEESGITTYGARVRTRVLPLPPSPLPETTRKAPEFLACFGVPADARVLLFLGRIDRKKGLDHLIKAMTHLSSDVHLLVAGGGEPEFEKELQRLTRDLDLGTRVHFIGWVSGEAKTTAFQSAMLFILLSHNENYGITVVEAAQAGLPSVLTEDVYASPQLIDAGAAVVTSRDPREAADTISGILGDNGRLAALRRGCRRLMDSILEEDAIAERYSELLSEI